MSILKTEDLMKKFGRFKALDKVNIEVKEGEVYGFIGPNGSGKSTTIRILLGMLRATGGEATIFGRDVWDEAVAIHRRIAYVPGDVNLWPNLTGGEVIDLFMELRGSKHQRKRDELIQKFDFDPSKKCRTYSKGNRQKVSLIAAFASDADLYILDEPTSGLDPLMERTFQECVTDAKNQGKSILLSSHILSEVERLCDRIGIIRKGQIIESGSLDELRHLTRTNLLIETREQVTSLDELEGVHNIEAKNEGLSFQVDTDKLDAVVRYISQFGVKKLESGSPTLEDLFMRHYEGTSHEGAGGES